MVTKRKSNPADGIDLSRSRSGIDLNKSRRAAQNAMDAMRKNRMKRGRIKVSRGTRLGTGRRAR